MADWLVKPLGEVCTIKPPKAEARGKLADSDEVSFVPMEDLGIGVKYLQPYRSRQLGEVSGSYTYFAEGDVLLAKITPCFENGKLGIARGLINGIGFGSSEYIVLRPAPVLNTEFLYYYLAQPTFLDEGARTMTGAVGHKRITKEFVESYPIPLPPLPEQRRIVAILDEAIEGIATAKANAEKNLKNAQEVFEGHVDKLFSERRSTWKEAPLSAFAVSISTGPFGSLLHKSDYVSDGVPLVNPINIVDGSIIPNPDKLIDDSTKQRLQSYVLAEGDIVVGRRGEIGRCAVVGREEAGWVCGTGCFFIRPQPTVRASFIANLIRSSSYRSQLESASTGATMQNLSNVALGNLLIAIPDLNEQDAILNAIDKLSEESLRLAFIYEQKITALDELKKSLLHQAFTGAL